MNKWLAHLAIFALLLILTAAPAAAQEPVFPIIVEHKYGSTEITAEPQRVVAIGYTEQDYLLVLGVTPVAVRYWYGDETNAIFPWAEDFVEGDNPIVLNMPFGNLNYEAILALEPDLISAVTAGITQEEYALLSQIAPTVAQPDGYIDFGVPWQVAAQLIGDAVGKSAEAAAAVEEVEGLFADVRAQNPQFAGKTVAVAYSFGGAYGFYTDQDTRARFFTDLGFVVPDELIEIAGENFFAELSAERMDLLDQDLIVMVSLQFVEGGREALEADPLWSQLEAVQDGRVVYFDLDAENALGFSSPLSLPFALDAALPQLQAMFPADAASAECEPGFRLFDHVLLVSDPVCIPEAPQRIAALDRFSFETMLALGIQPIGASSFALTVTRDLPYLQAAVSDVMDLGQPPNIELLVELAPDIILSTTGYGEYEQLAAIAPTIQIDFANSGQWQEIAQVFGSAVGREAEIAERFAEYDARLDAFGDAVGDPSVISVSVVRVAPDYISLYSQDQTSSFLGTILGDAGVAIPTQQAETLAANSAFDGTISLEQLLLADADVLLIWTFATNDEVAANAQTALDDLLASPLWSALSAVENERTYEVGGYWIGSSLHAAHAVIDDLFTYVAEVDPSDVAPNPFTTQS
jgi:iron complex transport system substrate-binding protein